MPFFSRSGSSDFDPTELSGPDLSERLARTVEQLSVSEGADRATHELELGKLELEVANRDLREKAVLLEESRAYYDHLYRSAPVPLMTLDEHAVIRELNDAAVEMLGASADYLRGKPFVPLARPEDVNGFFDFLKRCRGSTGPSKTVVRLGIVPDRTLQATGVSAARTLAPVAGVRVALVELDAHRERRATQLLEALADSVPGWSIIELDGADTIRSWNVGARRIYGFEAKEVLGRHVSFLCGPDGLRDVRALRSGAGGAAPASQESERRRKDGSSFRARITWRRLVAEGARDTFAELTHVLARARSTEKEDDLEHELGALVVKQLGRWALRFDLTLAEQEVLLRVVAGHSNKEIAHERATSISTVRSQVSSVLRKTKTSSRGELCGRIIGVKPHLEGGTP